MEVKRRSARTLVKRLSSAGNDDESLTAAIAEVRLLSKHDPDIRSPLANAGAVPHLSRRLVCGGNHPASQADAAAALLNLSIAAPESLMSTPGLLDALAALLIGPPMPPTAIVKDALKALFGVALYPLNRTAMVAAGAVPVLFSVVVRDGRAGIVEDATAVIAQVAGCYESVEAFRRVAGVRVLVDLVDAGGGSSVRVRENAAAALLNLTLFGGDAAVGDIREVEEAETAVAELAENGSARAKNKAEALLRIIQSGRGSNYHHRFSGNYDSLPAPHSSSSVDNS